MPSMLTEIIINAPKEAIWKVLTDFDSYGEWNPLIVDIQAATEVGHGVKFKADLKGKKLPFGAKMRRCEENRELSWGGPGFKPLNLLAGADHYYRIEEIGDNQCRFIHGETFYGILPMLFSGWIASCKPLYDGMNKAMKERVEGFALVRTV